MKLLKKSVKGEYYARISFIAVIHAISQSFANWTKTHDRISRNTSFGNSIANSTAKERKNPW